MKNETLIWLGVWIIIIGAVSIGVKYYLKFRQESIDGRDIYEFIRR